MTVAAGTISFVSYNASTQVLVLSSTAATGGTGPYTYQWYYSTTTGFSPGGGNIISGATSLTLTQSGVIPGTQYYYVVVATDTGHSNDTANSAQFSELTSGPQLNPNQFAGLPLLGSLDQTFNFNTHPAQIDPSQSGALVFGAAVKIVDAENGNAVPTVVGCSANSDNVYGFINFNIKNTQFVAGNLAEISTTGNVMYLYATTAIGRGAPVCLSITTNGGVQAATSGARIVGWAYDKASAPGALIRVYIYGQNQALSS